MQSFDSSLRQHCTQDLILSAFVDQLRCEIDGYNDQNCYESDDPVPATHPGGDEFCTVSMGAGTYPAEFYAGAGHETLTEMGSIIIAPTVPMRGDRINHRRRRLIDDTDRKSLLQRKIDILRALFATQWEPVFQNRPLLRDMPSMTRCTAPGEVMVGEARYLQIQLTIQTTFDWDLMGSS